MKTTINDLINDLAKNEAEIRRLDKKAEKEARKRASYEKLVQTRLNCECCGKARMSLSSFCIHKGICRSCAKKQYAEERFQRMIQIRKGRCPRCERHLPSKLSWVVKLGICKRCNRQLKESPVDLIEPIKYDEDEFGAPPCKRCGKAPKTWKKFNKKHGICYSCQRKLKYEYDNYIKELTDETHLS